MFCCRKDVCLRLCIDKTCIRDFFLRHPVNTDILARPLGVRINGVPLYNFTILSTAPFMGEMEHSNFTRTQNCYCLQSTMARFFPEKV